MSFGNQLLAWRNHRGLTQAELAQKANIPRPYISRLELDKADPSLSLLRRLAVSLDIYVGDLVEKLPPTKILSNKQLDLTARAALKPSAVTPGAVNSYVRPLSRLLKQRRAALGLYKPRKKRRNNVSFSGVHSLRRLKSKLGEAQWRALLKRIDKQAIYLAPIQHKDWW